MKISEVAELIKKAQGATLPNVQTENKTTLPSYDDENGKPVVTPVTPSIETKQTNAPSQVQNAVKTSNQIKVLQQTMIDLINKVKTDNILPKRSDNKSEGYGSFFDFAFNRYTTKSKTSGSTFLDAPSQDRYKKTPDIGKDEFKHATEEKPNLEKFVHTTQYIGRHTDKGESIPDGIWSTYTNNALKNVYAFANTIFTLFKELSIPAPKFDLNTFYKLIPTDEQLKTLTIVDKQKRAQQLTNLVKSLTNAYDDFNTKLITTYGQHGPQTSQTTSFDAEYGTTDFKDHISPVQYLSEQAEKLNIGAHGQKLVDLAEQNMNTVITQIPQEVMSKSNDTAVVKVPLSALSDLEAFKEFLKGGGGGIVMFNNKPAYLSPEGIKEALNKVISSL
jgi:hypothetical protein